MAKTCERPPRRAVPAPTADADGAEGAHFEQKPFWRAWISAFIVVLLAAMVFSAAPASELREAMDPWRQPVTDATGLFQNWNLFAPDPSSATMQLEARLTYDDGTRSTWSPPTAGPILGVYRSFRWRKWASRVMSDDYESLRAPAARYIASINHREAGYPVEIVLVQLTYQAPPAGSGERPDPEPDWQEEILSTHRYTPEGTILEDSVAS